MKIGKDADIVVWSGHPLSVYSKAEQTIVDGYVLYDSKRDVELRKEIAAERARLVAKMLKAKLSGAPTQKIKGKKNRIHDCNVFTDDGN